MRTKRHLRAARLALAFVSMSALAHAGELHGTVRANSGEPVAGVQVTSNHPQGQALSDGSGYFSMPSHSNVVFFRAAGYKLVTRVLTTENELNIVLEPDPEPARSIPDCKSVEGKGKRAGSALRVIIPPDAVARRDKYVEYFVDYVSFGQNHDMWLAIWSGGMTNYGQPDDRTMLAANDVKGYSVRFNDGSTGLDITGQRGNRSFRWIGRSHVYATYENIPPEAAAYFDKILATVCTDTGSWRKLNNLR